MKLNLGKRLVTFFVAALFLVVVNHAYLWVIDRGLIFKTVYLFASSGAFAWLVVLLVSLVKSFDELSERVEKLERKFDETFTVK